MTKKICTYKGFTGKFEYDDGEKIFTGEIIGTRDVITFKGRTPDEIQKSFEQSVDLYLKMLDDDGLIPHQKVLYDLGISEADLDAADDVEIELVHMKKYPLKFQGYPRIKSVETNPNLILIVEFQNGIVKSYDCQQLLQYPKFAPLKDKNFFDSAHVDVGRYNVVWNNSEMFLTEAEIWINGIDIKK